jgi:hypothetical protein
MSLSKSGIKIWLHPETMSLVASWHVFACTQDEASAYFISSSRTDMTLTAYNYIGEAVDNGEIILIFEQSYLERHFELIGEL